MDNRLGCFVALEAARLVAEAGGAPGDVVAVAAVQEEITFGGARTTALPRCDPDVAIVVDVTHATDAPGIDETRARRATRFGSGPVIERGSTLHPVVFELLHEAAEAEDIPFTRRGLARAAPAPTPTRSTSRATASRPGSCRSRCATCTRRSRWSQLDDVDNAARADRRVRQRLAGGHLLRALSVARPARAAVARCSSCSTSTGRCCSRPAPSTRAPCSRRSTDVYGVEPRRGLPVDAAGRTDTEIAREILLLSGVDARTIDDAPRRRSATPPCAGTPSSRPDDLTRRLAPGAAEVARRAGGRRRAPAVARDRQPRADRAAQAARAPGSAGTSRPARAASARTPRTAATCRRSRAPAPRRNGGEPCPRERTVVIGDTPRDIACARADGVHVVAVADRAVRAERLGEADAVIGTLDGLPAALDALLLTAPSSGCASASCT